jgi:mRNA-degrading endonuclease RelE of RelBE toxin-antitoxin system
LKGKHATFKRLRAGEFRVIFDTENRIMNIYQIKHRKEAYR